MKVIGSVAVSFILTVSLVSGALLHAVIPHSHGDGHHNESGMWIDLHNALSHEDKKNLPSAVSSPILVILATIAGIMMTGLGTTLLRTNALVAKSRDPNAGELLRRGIHKYRAFA